MEQNAWLSTSAKILSDVKEWRKAHSKATFVEIEDEVHRRMMQLEAQLLQDAAQESSSRAWGKKMGEKLQDALPGLGAPCKHEASRRARYKAMEEKA